MGVALYADDAGFFARGRGAGRAGADFVTSPKVGGLFATLVGRALDAWWDDLGAPDPFVVVEAGAGDGQLAHDVAHGAPRCRPALRYLLVERSPRLRDAQRDRLPIEPPDEALGGYQRETGEDRPVPATGIGPVFSSLDDLPATPFVGAVFANELLDNLPFGIAQWTGSRFDEVLVGVDGGERFVEVLVPARDSDDAWLRELTAGVALEPGARLPIARGIDEWFRACAGALHRGWCCLVDYAATATELAARGSGWLRTYAGHGRGQAPLDAPGEQDITADVMVEAVRHSAHASGFVLVEHTTQSAWLRGLGVDELVAAGEQRWRDGAAHGGLDALAGRSVVNEAAALTDPAGLGAHHVFVLRK